MQTLEPGACPGASAPGAADRAPAISARGLVVSDGGFRAVGGLDLEIAQGEFFGLLGPYGAGKTTVVELIAGLRLPTSGWVRVLNRDPVSMRGAVVAGTRVRPLEPRVFGALTVTETLGLFAAIHEAPRAVGEVAHGVGLADQAGTRVGDLSMGQRRKLHFGVAIIGDPRVLVLDEPTAGLGPAARHELWSLVGTLRERGTTVLVTTQRLDEAATLCDRVAVLIDGVMVALGAPENLIGQPRRPDPHGPANPSQEAP